MGGGGGGGADVHGAAVGREQDETIELLEERLPWLVDDRTDGDAVRGEAAERGGELERGGRVEAGGGLVEENERRVGDHLQSDVDALALAAGEAAPRGVADDRVALLRQTEEIDHRPHPAVELRPWDVARQPDLGRETQQLVDGERRQHHVVLRDEGDELRDLRDLEPRAVDAERAARRRQLAREQPEQRRLAAARRPHDRRHLARPHLARRVGEHARPVAQLVREPVEREAHAERVVVHHAHRVAQAVHQLLLRLGARRHAGELLGHAPLQPRDAPPRERAPRDLGAAPRRDRQRREEHERVEQPPVVGVELRQLLRQAGSLLVLRHVARNGRRGEADDAGGDAAEREREDGDEDHRPHPPAAALRLVAAAAAARQEERESVDGSRRRR